jgi:hypothetical protein
LTKSAKKKRTPKQRALQKKQATSTELTRGAGFTYEDKVVAYYLAALLRGERAMLQRGTVSSAAVQQAGHGQPMDDLIVEFRDTDGRRTLGLQVKSTITVSGAATNRDFRDVLNRARETWEAPGFRSDRDAYGYIVENAAEAGQRSLSRLIDWAVSSPTPAVLTGASGKVAELQPRSVLFGPSWPRSSGRAAPRMNGISTDRLLPRDLTASTRPASFGRR